MCRAHHRQHHLGVLAITGNADTPAGEPGAFEVRDRWGHVLDPCGTPIRPRPGHHPAEAARAVGVEPGTYVHPLGERLDRSAVTFNPNGSRPAPRLLPPLEPDPPADDHDHGDEGDGELVYGTPGWTEPDEPWPTGFDPETLTGADPPAARTTTRA
ncbi:hypothetical protein [Aquihabitans sp. G128]|uniref:hypothetical protein n=1 Tax=Aquihabitans sp. G128 TaxID=2849779 RepID=UPI0020B2FAEB|nr:hypothetical protein [Aquihabitans sp. G128]